MNQEQNQQPRIITRLVNYGNLIMGDNSHVETGTFNVALPGQTLTVEEEEKSLRRSLNKSYMIAQFPPGFICLLPVILPNIVWQYQHPLLQDLPVLWQATLYFFFISAPCIGVSYLIAFLSHAFEKRLFPTLTKSPFCYLLSYSNDRLSKTMKDTFRQSFKKTFEQPLPELTNGENDDEQALIAIGKVAAEVKQKAKNSKHLQLLRVRYQFTRNSITAAKLGLVLGICMIIYGLIISDLFTIVIEAKLMLFYLVVFAQQRKLLVRSSENYTVQLIRDFNQFNN